MFEAVRLDPPARFEDTDFPQMRIFSREAAEIVPHAADHSCNMGLGEAGKGTADVAPGMFGDAQKGANAARQRPA